MKIQPAFFLAGLAIFCLVVVVASVSSSGDAAVSLASSFTDRVETSVKLSASGAEIPVETIQSPLPDNAWNAIAKGLNIAIGAIVLILSWLSKSLHLLANIIQFASDRIEAIQSAQQPEPTDEEVDRETAENSLLDELDSDNPNPIAIAKQIEVLTKHKVRLAEGVSNANVQAKATESTTSIFSK